MLMRLIGLLAPNSVGFKPRDFTSDFLAGDVFPSLIFYTPDKTRTYPFWQPGSTDGTIFLCFRVIEKGYLDQGTGNH